MHTCAFLAFTLGLGKFVIGGADVQNSVQNSTLGRGQLNIGGFQGGGDGIGGEKVKAATSPYEAAELVWTMSKVMGSGNGAAKPLTTTARAGSGDVLPTAAPTASWEKASSIRMTALDAERATEISIGILSSETVTTTTEDIKELSTALVADGTPTMKSHLQPLKTTAVRVKVEESPSTLEAVIPSSSSSDSWTRIEQSDRAEGSTPSFPITTSTLTEGTSESKTIESAGLGTSIVSSNSARPALSTSVSGSTSTIQRMYEKATASPATTMDAEIIATRRSNGAIISAETIRTSGSNLEQTTTNLITKSASLATLIASSSVAEDCEFGSTKTGVKASRSLTTSSSANDSETSKSTIMPSITTDLMSLLMTSSFVSKSPTLSKSSSEQASTSTKKAEKATPTSTKSSNARTTKESRTGGATTQWGTIRSSGLTTSHTLNGKMIKNESFTTLLVSSSRAKITESVSRGMMEDGSRSKAGSTSIGSIHSLKAVATMERNTKTAASATALPEKTEPDRESRNSTAAALTESGEAKAATCTHSACLSMTSKSAHFTTLLVSSSGSEELRSGSTKTAEVFSRTLSAIRWDGMNPNSRLTAATVPSMTSKLTSADGNGSELDGLPRTSSQQSLMRSIMITPTSKIASTMATLTTYLTSLSMTTSFVSKSSSSTSTSVESSTGGTFSMRPNLTDCVDDFDFFEMTDANLAESGTIAWYADWTSRASSGPDAATFHSMGEVPYFGRVWLRNPDYICGLELGGCTQRPSCNEILKLYPNDAEMARRVYFTMKMQATVNQVMKSYYEAIHTTQTNLASVMKKIVDTTFQTPQMDDLQACQFLKTAYNNMYNLMAELAMPILNGKQGLGSDWFKAPVRSDTNPSGEGVKYLQFKDPYGNEKQGFMFWKGKAETAYRWWAQEALGTMAASTAMCEGLGVVNLNKGGAEEGMRNALLKISQFQRKELSQHVQRLNQGAFQEEGEMSAMAGMLGMGIWSNESSSAVDILTDPYQLEEMMTEQSKSSLLSRAYLLNKCYLKCTTHPHASLLCQGYNDWEFGQNHAQKHGYPFDSNHPGPGSKMAEAERLMRICPTENKVCQVECWSQERKGWTQPLHNIGQLGTEPLGVDIQSKMGEIYAYYKEHGNVNPHPDDVAAVEDNPAAKITGEARGPHFWLPVCDSDQGYTHIVDFGQQKHGKLHMDQFSRSQDRRSFPISCGNYRSDQTPEFMEAMGLTNFKTKNVQWTMNPFFKNYAPLNAAVLIEAPLDNFLALCRLGLQYPQADTKDVKNGQMDIRREASQFCAPIEKETEGMPWFTANLFFCKKSEAAKELFGLQGPSGGILGLHKVKNHRRLCERWLATQEAEQMHGMEEMDAGQGKDRWIGPKHEGNLEEVHRFQYGSKGKAWHPKWRDRHDLLGSVLLGRRGVLWGADSEALHASRPEIGVTEQDEWYIYDSTEIQDQDDGGESGVQHVLSQCQGREGIGFGWHFVCLLFRRGGMEAMGGGWKLLFRGHRDLRKFVADVDFEGSENTRRYVRRKLNSRDLARKRETSADDEGKVDGAAEKITYTVPLDMEEVRREEEMYWNEIEEMMKEENEESI